MLQTLKSNSPFSVPRDDTVRAGYGKRTKSNFLPFLMIGNLELSG
jgi:hypothetical protein